MTKVPTRKRWEVVLQWKYIISLWLVSYFALLLLFPYKNNIPEPVVPNPDSVVLPVVPVPDIPAPPVVIPVVPDELVMTAQQAKLTRQAIELIREDVLRGSIPTADLAIQALSALLPSSVRQRVLQELGTPDIEYMRDALDILDGKIIIQE